MLTGRRPPMWLFAAVLFAAAAALLIPCWFLAPPAGGAWWTVAIVFGVIGFLLGAFVTHDGQGVDYSVSLAVVLLVGAIVLGGPLAAVPLALFMDSGLLVYGPLWLLRRAGVPGVRAPSSKVMVTAVNGSSYLLQAAAAGLVYLLLGGQLLYATTLSPAGLVIHGLLPAVAVGATVLVISTGTVSAAIALDTSNKFWGVFTSMTLLVWTLYLAGTIIAFLEAVLWGAVPLGAASLVLMIPPLAVGHFVLVRRAYVIGSRDGLTDVLSAVGQAHEPHLAGRGELVNQVARRMAEALTLAVDDQAAVRMVAQLRDVGLAAPLAHFMPVSPERLSRAEIVRVLQHPQRSCAMLARVDAFASVQPAILHHHERWDGLGWPQRLHSEQIPLAARIVAVASGFCAVLAWSPNRSFADALDQVAAYSGTIYDPACVLALQRAAPILENGPRFTAALAKVTVPESGTLDPDLPQISEMLAEHLQRTDPVAQV